MKRIFNDLAKNIFFICSFFMCFPIFIGCCQGTKYVNLDGQILEFDDKEIIEKDKKEAEIKTGEGFFKKENAEESIEIKTNEIQKLEEISECPSQEKIMLYRDEDGDGFGLNGIDYQYQYTGKINPTLYSFDIFCLEFNEEGEPDIKVTVKKYPGWIWMDKATLADCNDKDPMINQKAKEICNGLDDNCNFDIDDVDNDNDFFIDSSCGGDDCDDSDPTINQEAQEICDGIDHNCNGLVNEKGAKGCVFVCLCDPCNACEMLCLCL